MRCRDGIDLRVCDRQVTEHPDLPGNTGQAQAIAAVRRQIDLDHGVVERQLLAQRCADFQIFRQIHDAVRIVAQTQLRRAAQHAEAFDLAQLGLLDLEVVGQHRADPRKGRDQTRTHIRRAAHHLMGLGAVEDLADRQLVGIGVRFDRVHPGHDHPVKAARHGLRAVDFQPGHGELLQQLGLRCLDRDPLAQPLFTELHARRS